MTTAIEGRKPIPPRLRKTGVLLFGLVLSALLVTGSFATGGFRINLTPSKPPGLWRIRTLERPVRPGDLVFVCPPDTAAMRQARRRGYLRRGLCPGGFAPLIKAVGAIAGQRVAIGAAVRVEGALLPRSRVERADGRGRAMIPYAGGVVLPGSVYLHSDFEGSFDSRYFGPLPAENILGLAEGVWTIAP